MTDEHTAHQPRSGNNMILAEGLGRNAQGLAWLYEKYAKSYGSGHLSKNSRKKVIKRIQRLRAILTMAARDKPPCLIVKDMAIKLAVIALCAEKSNSVLLDKIAYTLLHSRYSTFKPMSIPPGPLLPKGVKPNDD